MTKVALAMMVKSIESEAFLLERCLENVADYVDGIFIQLNYTDGQQISTAVRAVAENYTKPHNIEVYKWQNNFAKARNDNFAQVPSDYSHIIWLDADDTVEHPEKIKEVATIMPKNVYGLYVCYDYAHDEFSNVSVSHWNCRLVRNNGSYRWKSSFEDSEVSVHEHLSPVRAVGQTSTNDFKVVHHADSERSNTSLVRNITILEGMYERQLQKKQLDPRTVFYLGTHYYDIGRYKETINLLTDYLKVSGWAEERSAAHIFIGKVLKSWGKESQARTAFLMALGEAPDNQDAFLELGKLELANKRYPEAVKWLEQATKIKQEVYTLVRFHNQYELYMKLAEGLTQLGGKNLSKALRVADKALRLRPLDPEAKTEYEKIEQLVEYSKNQKSIARIVRLFKADTKLILPFIELLPKDYQDSPVVVGTKLKFRPFAHWPKKSMAIYCGASPLDIWGPWSLKDGIGGSEEAVIQLSQELADLGWQVTVYSTPGERAGQYNGVVWKQYWEINPADEFDVLVAWRNPGFFELGWQARKKYVWMHDVMPQTEFSETTLQNLTKVILLSKYHRSLYPNIPDNKVFLSSNGIVPEDFATWDNRFRRDPARVIYMSSHVRGLEVLYHIWKDVKKAVPKAKLDIYYGWDSFINILKDNPDRMGWRERMIKWEKELPDVKDHGKISHEQIVQEIFKSGVWAYPCPFPEIYCITAIKAQAGGAVPVSSNFAALAETVRFGAQIPMKSQEEDMAVGQWDKTDIEKFKLALIEMLKNPKQQQKIRPGMMEWARTQSWSAVASQWDLEMK